MKSKNSFFRTVCNLAIPVALQSMLQASFSVVDQIMIGQLGSTSVAGVGLAGKFSSVFSVVVSAIGAVAGIMISQYMGQRHQKEVCKSFKVNLLFAIGIAGIFTALCILIPRQIMGLYTQDDNTAALAANYLIIISGTFLPLAGATLLSTLFRCMEKTVLPLIASIVAAFLNTSLNYILIFGKLGFEPMGVAGAAIATVVAQLINMLVLLVFLIKYKDEFKENNSVKAENVKFNFKQYAYMLLPVLVCEFMWSLGENVYAAIYGHLGTDACAAMTLINPVQSLMIGALCGLSQAAGVIVGKKLGNNEYDEAYKASERLIYYGLLGSVCLSAIIILLRYYYVDLYQVNQTVKLLAKQILIAYAIIAPFKVLNMIVSGGILRSGGKTKYVMMIDLIGTWVFGVPLGLISAFLLHFSIPYVYFILSLEECIRFLISIIVFKKRQWMRTLKS